jgi:hypothetical protein
MSHSPTRWAIKTRRLIPSSDALAKGKLLMFVPRPTARIESTASESKKLFPVCVDDLIEDLFFSLMTFYTRGLCLMWSERGKKKAAAKHDIDLKHSSRPG